MRKARITKYICDRGVMAKTFTVNEDGKVVKKYPGKISTGKYAVHTLDLKHLQSALKDLPRNRCIGLGSPVRDEGRITWLAKHRQMDCPEDPIPRNLDNFKFKPEPTLILYDIDNIPGTLDEALEKIGEIDPGFAAAEKLVIPSSSAGIMLNGEPVSTDISAHVYVMVERGDDIPRYMDVLFQKLWIAGYGHIELSSDGKANKRAIIDRFVASPERIIYEAAPVLHAGLTQERLDSYIIEGGILDTYRLEDLVPAEHLQLREALDAAQEKIAPTQDRMRAKYVKVQSKALKKRNKDLTQEQAELIIERRQNAVLDDDDLLVFEDHDVLRVGDVLDKGEEFDGSSLSDPAEPEYDGGSRTKARFFWNDGHPRIHSFAHGSKKYQFKRIVDARDLATRAAREERGLDPEPPPPPIPDPNIVDLELEGLAGGTATSQFPPETTAALRGINKDFAVGLLGSKMKILMEAIDHGDNRNTISFLGRESFVGFHENRRYPVIGANGAIRMDSLGKIWMGWEGRRTYKQVVFSPNEAELPPGAYNLFRGFPIRPRKSGSWIRMEEHMREVLCEGRDDLFQYLMGLMARTVQDPGGPRPGVAVVMLGGKGVGKGAFMDYYGSIFGEYFVPISSAAGFASQFNMHLSKALVVFLDEAVWGGDKQKEGRLKALITEFFMLFEPKGVDAITLRNFANVFMASNEAWAVPAGMKERRFFVLCMNPIHQQDIPYFRALKMERFDGGVERLMQDLYDFDLTKVDLYNAPKTDGLAGQVAESLDDVGKFWHEVLEREHILTDRDSGHPVKAMEGKEADIWPTAAYKYEIYQEFASNFCRNRPHTIVASKFWRITKDWWKRQEGRQERKAEGVRARVIMIPKIEKMRLMFTEATGIRFTSTPSEPGQSDLPWDDQF